MDTRRFVDNITESASCYPHTTFSKKGAIYTCVNPYAYHLVRKYPEIYNQLDGLYVDGMLMCQLINLMWNRNIPRLSFDMSGMAVDLFKRLDGSGESIYFIGSKQEALKATINQIKGAYPNMNISGYRNGYFLAPKDRENEIIKIVRLNPDFVIVGMGSPIQEKFCIDLKNAGYKGIAFTCGGFLHQTADGINYYPEWVDKYNLRAFYRLFHEKGLWKRLYNVLLEFPILFTYDTIKARIFKCSAFE